MLLVLAVTVMLAAVVLAAFETGRQIQSRPANDHDTIPQTALRHAHAHRGAVLGVGLALTLWVAFTS